jgi:hypothetical protein
MSDPESPVAAVSSVSTAEANRDDLVERLKKELAEKTEAAALAHARASVYEDRERERVTGFQPEAQYFMKEFLKEEIESHHPGTTLLADVAPLAAWSDEFAGKRDITSQSALAACSYIASKGIKRLRDEASRGATAQETLASTLKENESLRSEKEKLQRDFNDQVSLSEERQRNLEALQEELTRAGLFNQKFDFSKLTSREAAAPPAEPHTTTAEAAVAPALEAVKAEASRAARAGASRGGNPLEQNGDLLESLLSRSSAGPRMQSSGTTHAFLGAQQGDVGTDLKAIARAMH